MNIYIIFIIYFRLNETRNLTINIGHNIEEVFNNLLILGRIYDLDMVDEDFYRFDLVHSVLLNVYGGGYPISDILASVRR